MNPFALVFLDYPYKFVHLFDRGFDIPWDRTQLFLSHEGLQRVLQPLHSIRDFLLPFVHHLSILDVVALDACLLNLQERMTLGDGAMAFGALYLAGHYVRLRLLFSESFSPDKLHLRLMAIGTFGIGLVMTAQAFHPRFIDLSMLSSRNVTNIAVQQSGDMLLVRERNSIDGDLRIFKPSVTFAALRMGDLCRLRQRNGPFGMALGARGFLPTMAFEAGFFGWPEGGGIMGVMVNIVVAAGTGVFQFFDMEKMWNGNIERIDLGRRPLHIKNPLMAADAIWIDLIKFGRETRMLPSSLKRKDVDAGNQGMASRMTLRTVDLGMQSRLLPKGGLPLLLMACDTEFLLGCRIGGQGHGSIENQNRQSTP